MYCNAQLCYLEHVQMRYYRCFTRYAFKDPTEDALINTQHCNLLTKSGSKNDGPNKRILILNMFLQYSQQDLCWNLQFTFSCRKTLLPTFHLLGKHTFPVTPCPATV